MLAIMFNMATARRLRRIFGSIDAVSDEVDLRKIAYVRIQLTALSVHLYQECGYSYLASRNG